MRLRNICTLLLVSFMLAGCGSHLTDGTVVSKHYEPAHTWLMPQTICTGGKNSTCNVNFIPVFEPDAWTVTVENCQVSDKWKKDTWRIPESMYNEVTNGQVIHKPE